MQTKNEFEVQEKMKSYLKYENCSFICSILGNCVVLLLLIAYLIPSLDIKTMPMSIILMGALLVSGCGVAFAVFAKNAAFTDNEVSNTWKNLRRRALYFYVLLFICVSTLL